MIEYYNEDCMEGMKRYKDKHFSLAICDPPYGINIANMNMGIGKGAKCSKEENRNWVSKNWDIEKPNNDYFDELFRITKNQIIWGSNYFNLPVSHSFIVWDKAEGMYNRSFSECELAWSSFNKNAKIFKLSPVDKSRIHPTQKPVKLYKWLLHNYAKKGDLILDTHVGSASSLIACYDMGFDAVGFELDKDYYEASKKRLEEFMAQGRLF